MKWNRPSGGAVIEGQYRPLTYTSKCGRYTITRMSGVSRPTYVVTSVAGSPPFNSLGEAKRLCEKSNINGAPV